MTEMVKLQAPEGFTDVSFGSQSYEVGENGVVEVPVEAAQFLYQFGFGNVVEEPDEDAEKAKAEAERKAAEDAEKAKRGRKSEAEKTE